MTQTTDILKVQLGAVADSKSRTPFAPGGMFLAYVFASGSLTSLACVHNQTCSGPSATRGSRGGAGCRAAAPLRRAPGPRITGACPRDVPEPPPTANDRHQQQPANMKPARPSSPRPTPENTLVMRSSRPARRGSPARDIRGMTPTSCTTSWCAWPTSDPLRERVGKLPWNYADTHMHIYVFTFRQP